MKRMGIAVFLAGACWVALGTQTAYAPHPFERYQPILERMPFGPLPPNFTEAGDTPAAAVDPAQVQSAAEVKAEQQQLAKQVKMSCVNITPGGEIKVGFTDNGEKPPVNYYLSVGEARKGWKVLDADYDKEWAQIAKDEVTVTMKLGEGLIDAPPGSKGAETNAVALAVNHAEPARRTSAGTHEVSPARRRTFSGRTSLLPRERMPQEKTDTPLSPAAGSFTERLRKRTEEQQAARAAQDAEAQKKLVEMARRAVQQEVEKQRQEEASEAQNIPQEEGGEL